MRIINHTRLEDSAIKAMVRSLTKGITRRIHSITISYTRKHTYKGLIQFHFSKKINVAFAKQETGLYPISMNGQRHTQFNFPKYQVNNEYEACLAVLAHEIYHLKAHIYGWRGTEKKAEDFAFKRLTKFRENN